VAQVRIWDGTAIDSRSESEREAAAFEKAARQAHAFTTSAPRAGVRAYCAENQPQSTILTVCRRRSGR